MTVAVGTASIYHTRLPHQRKLERMARNLDLSKEARVRLTWLTHYKKHANASVTSADSLHLPLPASIVYQ